MERTINDRLRSEYYGDREQQIRLYKPDELILKIRQDRERHNRFHILYFSIPATKV